MSAAGKSLYFSGSRALNLSENRHQALQKIKVDRFADEKVLCDAGTSPAESFACVHRCRALQEPCEGRARAECDAFRGEPPGHCTRAIFWQALCRSRYGLDLLPGAQEFARNMLQVFDSIADTAQAFKDSLAAAEQTITIKTYTTFAARWLIPRLPHFFKLHPPDQNCDQDRGQTH